MDARSAAARLRSEGIACTVHRDGTLTAALLKPREQSWGHWLRARVESFPGVVATAPPRERPAGDPYFAHTELRFVVGPARAETSSHRPACGAFAAGLSLPAPERAAPPQHPAEASAPPAAPSSAAGGPPPFEALLARFARLEEEVLSGGRDRRIPLEDVAKRLRHTPSTLRAWAKDPERVATYRLDLLLVVLPDGTIYSTPRLLAQWEDAIRLQWQRVLYGTGRRPGERLAGVASR